MAAVVDEPAEQFGCANHTSASEEYAVEEDGIQAELETDCLIVQATADELELIELVIFASLVASNSQIRLPCR